MAKTKRMTVKEGERAGIFNYPNFHKSGSIRGMKKRYYGENALLVRCGDWIYNVPKEVYDMAH